MEQLVFLPDELKALLAVIITVAVTQALKWLSAQLKFDLSGYSAQVAAALVASALVLVNGMLVKIPAEFAPIANQILVLVVVVLASKGLYKSLNLPKG